MHHKNNRTTTVDEIDAALQVVASRLAGITTLRYRSYTFLEPTVTSLDILFSLINSQRSKDIQFSSFRSSTI